jgi:AAA family ATP:ADP antiporter
MGGWGAAATAAGGLRLTTQASLRADAETPSLLDRALRIFGDVRPGEAGTTLLMLSNLFLLLVGYYILKTVREPLILATGGAEMKSYASAGQALTLMGFIPLYGWLASRVDRVMLITWVLLFFIADIELFNLGLRVNMPNLGFVFFIWVGIFSLATIAQFWSYANDLYRKEDGERLFALIGIGATAGSWAGSKVAELLFKGGMAPADMLHVTALLLFAHLGLYRIVDAREARRDTSAAAAKTTLAGPGGFSLVFASPYLRLVGLLLVLLNIVNTTGEYVISRSVVAAADAAVAQDPSVSKEAFIGSFYGSYFFWVNFGAVLLQAFFAARIARYLGLAGVLLALPLVSLGAYGLIGAGVGFAVLRWAKTAENATDYSVMNTGRQMLWLPTTREEKYKAKQTLDTFFVRAGDVVSAGLVFAGTAWLGLGITGFARANVVLVLAWFATAYFLLRENRALVERSAREGA